MRLFIAVEIPEEVRDYLFDMQNKMHSLPAKVTWVHKKHLHLTLKFLGEVGEAKIGEIKEKLGKVSFEKFTARLSPLGVFPSLSYARVIWAGLEPHEEIIKLQQKVDEELIGLFPNEQNFHAHLTLGRVKFVKDKGSFADTIKNFKVEEKEFEIKNFKLMKSTLTGKGPVYEELSLF